MHKLCLVLLAICLDASDIRISEVMSNPLGSEYENEFVEIFNASDNLITIHGWILSDGNGVDSIIHFAGPHEISAKSFALILDPGYNYLSGPYQDLIPDSIPIFTIATDASFGSGGLSNSGESVLLIRPDSSVASEMSWTRSTSNGYSWERVSINDPDSICAWEESLVENGTPGFRNSVAPPRINLGIEKLSVLRTINHEPVEMMITLLNSGELDISDYNVSVYYDENQNGLQDASEWHNQYEFQIPILSHAGMSLPLELFEHKPGVHQVEFRVGTTGDERPDDDSLRIQFYGTYAQDVVSITEFMFSPSQEQGGEWFEIFNRSDSAVSLQDWTFSDANQTRHLVSDSILILEPYSYLTLCPNENVADYFGLGADQYVIVDTWPALNSSSDSIRLFDAADHPIASIFYRGSWGTSGVSLERRHPGCFPFNPVNWRSSTHPDGATPSGLNTQTLLPQEIQVESISLQTWNATGPTQATIQIKFLNMGMDTLRILEIQSDADIFWYGEVTTFMSDSLEYSSPMLWPGLSVIPIKMFSSDIQLLDTLLSVNIGFPPQQIALNEIHYQPGDEQVEFLELVNIGSEPLNLLGWSFQDRSGTRGYVMSPVTVLPDSFFLFTAESLTLSEWTPTQVPCLDLSVWPSLNNSSDSIIIMDPSGARHIEYYYDLRSGSGQGRSLERLALWKDMEAEASWDFSQDDLGMTPGRQNSVYLPPTNLSVSRVDILDSLLWSDESFTMEVSLVNLGNSASEGIDLYIHLFQDDFLHFERSQQIDMIPPGDTLVFPVSLSSAYPGWSTLMLELRYTDDENQEDNFLEQEIFISGLISPLVINEVMPVPPSLEGEWVELYNRSDWDVNLRGWSIADDNESYKLISDTSLIIEQNGYMILSAEGNMLPAQRVGWIQALQEFPVLNNSEDAIMLHDPQNISMDQMTYANATGLVEGRSLERIRPKTSGYSNDNWGVSIDDGGSTPGKLNSLYLDVLPSRLTLSLEPNPFSPDGDNLDDELGVEYFLPFEQGVMTLMVYDMAGRKIAEPIQGRHVSHRGKFFWDGGVNYGGKAVTGLYIMKILVDDGAGKVWSEIRKVYLIR